MRPGLGQCHATLPEPHQPRPPCRGAQNEISGRWHKTVISRRFWVLRPHTRDEPLQTTILVLPFLRVPLWLKTTYRTKVDLCVVRLHKAKESAAEEEMTP